MKIWRRRLQRWLLWTVSGALIAAAVLVGVIQLALPWWASDPDRVARLLSSRLGSPVRIESTEPGWSRRGPVVALHGVRFGEGDSALRIGRAAWAVDFAGLVLPGRVFNEFRVQGLDVTLSRQDDGRWEVLGLPELLRGERRRSLSEVLQALPAFAVRDSRLQVRYDAQRPPLRVQLAELRWIGGEEGDHWRGRLRPSGSDDDSHDIELALDLALGRGHAYLHADDVRLSRWLDDSLPMPVHPDDGRLDLEAWLTFDDRGVHDAQAELAVTASTWRRSVDTKDADGDQAHPTRDADAAVRLPPLAMGTRWQREGANSRLLVDDLRIDGVAMGRVVGVVADGGLRLRATGLALAPLQGFAELAAAGSPAARRALRQGQPAGAIDVIDAEFAGGRLRQYALRVSGLVSSGAPGQPGLRGLDLGVLGDAEGLVAWPEAEGLVVDYPGVLAAPVAMDIGRGAISGWKDDDGWHFHADQLPIAGDGFQLRLAGGVDIPRDGPVQLDFGALVGPTQIEAVKAFWPLNRIPNTARWLNRALRGGEIVAGSAWLRGPVGPFPFPPGTGHFEATASVAEAGLDYHEEWPALRGIDADLVFENMSLAVQSRRARMAGVPIDRAGIRVENLKLPVLEGHGSGRGDGVALLDLLRRTPVEKRWGEHLEGMSLEGPARADVDLRVPLKPELGNASVDGRVTFAGAHFRDRQRQLDFTDVQGELQFTRHGISASGLAVGVAGEPAMLDLRIGDDVVDSRHTLEGQLRGRLPASALFGDFDYVAPMVARMDGRAEWRVRIEVPHADAAGSEPGARVRVDSDLRGIALDLPAPLAKSRGSALPLRLETRLSPEGQPRPLELRIGSLVHMKARLPSAGLGFAGAVALGGATPEQVPRLGLSISGQVPAFDLTGWLALSARGDDSATTWPPIMLRAGELGVFGRAFRDVDLQMLPADGTVKVQLRGPDIDGEIVWPKASEGRVVRGRFSRVHVPEAGSASLGGDLDPAAMPALDVEAEDVRIGSKHLGRTRLLAEVADGAFRVERFQARNSAFELDATGLWRRVATGDRSDFDIALRAPDLGRMLESFGFAALIEGGRTDSTIRGSWAGSPAAFALENIEGVLTLKVGSGRIIDIDPGVGRLFGLLNLREIPRRLVLDFRDIFSQGMRFSSIEGSFQLDVGEAYTDNVLLKSPSADILVTGRTGLILRDYDQTLEVTPRVGGTLPVVGVIAGGPAGAAAGLLMQGLMRAHKVSHMVYRVTGPWDDPVIIKQEPISGTPPRPRAERADMEPAT